MKSADAVDVLIVGAGPIGLTLASALARRGRSVALLERQPHATLAAPAPDGRDIALTHRSIALLQALGLWQALPADEIHPLREARVLDGGSPRFLQFEAPREGTLGCLVANHLLRRAAHAAARDQAGLRLVDQAVVRGLRGGTDAIEIALADGRRFEAALLVAADSRFSDTRRALGIGAQLRDFGRSVIVCRLAHAGADDGIAWECFGYGRTLAILPLRHGQVSCVVTARSDEAAALLAAPPEVFAAQVARDFGQRVGPLRLVGERHAYPLVATWAQRFVAPRAALAGDAAVGMHPVTAHGFNLGLYGIDALLRALHGAADPGDARLLSRYQAEHRRATRPIYLGTNALVGLFTDERPLARPLRRAVIDLAQRLEPLKATIRRRLTDRAAAH